MEVPGIRRVRSKTFRGASEISAQFDPATDMALALQRVQNGVAEVQGELEAVMKQVPQWEREHRDAVRELNRETTGSAIALMMDELRAGFCDLPDVPAYLDAVERDMRIVEGVE